MQQVYQSFDQGRIGPRAVHQVIEHLRGQAAYRQQQAKRLGDLARSDASRADALEESLLFVLTQLQPAASRFSFPNHELSSRKSTAVVIDDEEALDPVTARKDDAPAAVQAAIVKLAGAGSISDDGGLIQTTSG